MKDNVKILKNLNEFGIFERLKSLHTQVPGHHLSKVVVERLIRFASQLEGAKTESDREIASYVVECGNLVGDCIRELDLYKHNDAVKNFIAECNEFWNENRTRFILENSILSLLNEGKDAQRQAIDNLRESSTKDNVEFEIIENTKADLWVPAVKQLVEMCREKTGNFIGSANGEFITEHLFSFVEKTEKGFVFESDNLMLEFDGTSVKPFVGKVEKSFVELQSILRECNVRENELRFGLSNRIMLRAERTDEGIQTYIGSEPVEADQIQRKLASKGQISLRDNQRISSFRKLVENMDQITQIDIAYRVQNRTQPISATVFRLDESIFVQMRNTRTSTNEIREMKAEDAIDTVKKFMRYDISESVKSYIDGAEAIDEAKKQRRIEELEGEIIKLKESLQSVRERAKVLGTEDEDRIAKAEAHVQSKIDEKVEQLNSLTFKEEVNEEETKSETEENEQVEEGKEDYIEANLTTNFKSYKKGDEVQVNSLDYSSSGSNDDVEVVLPNNEIVKLKKKMVKVAI